MVLHDIQRYCMLNEKKLFLLFPPFICRIIFGINIQFWPNALPGFNFCWAGQSVFHGAGHSIPGFHVPVIGGAYFSGAL